MKSARQTAFEILNKIQRDESYSNLALDSSLDRAEIDIKDKRFVSALVYGVTERRITLDYNLSLYLSQPLKKLKPQVLTALRLGAYQILFMDKIPDSAAVNESVKLVKKNGAAFASGLVNAVLHKIAVNGLRTDGSMSVNFSAPEWLCKMWSESYGKESAEKLLEASFGAVENTLRVNTTKTNTDELCDILFEEGFRCEKNNTVANSLTVKSGGAIHKTRAYRDGLFHVQDTASQLCCKALAVHDGETVVDVCAAPGGKTLHAADRLNAAEKSGIGNIISCDLTEQKVKLISDNIKRNGFRNISVVKNDALVYKKEWENTADIIIADLPCSGLGVIGKKCDIKYKTKREDIASLSKIQKEILKNVIPACRRLFGSCWSNAAPADLPLVWESASEL